MIHLPEEFLSRMKTQLGSEYDSFLESYDAPRISGLRVNTLKCTAEDFPQIAPGNWEKIPWVENGYFVPGGIRMGASPLYAAGVFYLQEPSAMAPASRLEVHPGERVLDLCAAPGGKATELAAKLRGKGLLVANDISNSRAKALLRNLELFGAGNIFVTNEPPGKLSEVFEGYFDKVLVDAPCSGEGMFRKDEAVIGTWTPERPAWFANLQKDIAANAVKMLREGGIMMYSTCTFSPEEDEGTVSWILENFPEMHVIEMEGYEGFAPGHPEWGSGNPDLAKCVRIWPHHMQGEGHFLALLQKSSCETASVSDPGSGASYMPSADRTAASSYRNAGKSRKQPKKGSRPEKKSSASGTSGTEKAFAEEFLAMTSSGISADSLEIRGDRVYFSPVLPSGVRNLHFLRNGLFLGEIKKNRFEPSQSLAMSLSADTFEDCLNLSLEDERTGRYLSGETISVGANETLSSKGWKLVCVEGFALGWGKLVNGILKNKYPASWRRN